MFNDDPDTYAVIMIGEIGGTAEEEAAEWIKANMTKPVVGFIGGATAPPGKRMGHAGAIISGGKGTAAEKIATLEACGIRVAPTPSDMGSTLVSVLKSAACWTNAKRTKANRQQHMRYAKGKQPFRCPIRAGEVAFFIAILQSACILLAAQAQ